MSFYVTLPSNSSMDYYPNNTVTNYITKLPQTIDLKGLWSVGLSELQYSYSFYNVTESETQLLLYSYWKDGEEKVYDISPSAGHYESPNILINHINNAIAENEPKANVVRFSYNEISKKITIKFDKETRGFFSLLMSQPMAELLGFEWQAKQPHHNYREGLWSGEVPLNLKQNLLLGEDNKVELLPMALSYTATSICDLRRGFYSLYVYCSIVEHTVVGDSKVPLLRVVNVSGQEGKMVSKIYQNVQYIPVLIKSFSSIEIDIKDDAGRPIPFQRGRVIATLHFKADKPIYF